MKYDEIALINQKKSSRVVFLKINHILDLFRTVSKTYFYFTHQVSRLRYFLLQNIISILC